jgi:hypothetical protein
MTNLRALNSEISRRQFVQSIGAGAAATIGRLAASPGSTLSQVPAGDVRQAIGIAN